MDEAVAGGCRLVFGTVQGVRREAVGPGAAGATESTGAAGAAGAEGAGGGGGGGGGVAVAVGAASSLEQVTGVIVDGKVALDFIQQFVTSRT